MQEPHHHSAEDPLEANFDYSLIHPDEIYQEFDQHDLQLTGGAVNDNQVWHHR